MATKKKGIWPLTNASSSSSLMQKMWVWTGMLKKLSGKDKGEMMTTSLDLVCTNGRHQLVITAMAPTTNFHSFFIRDNHSTITRTKQLHSI